jgi:hypothetical protein
MSIEIKLNTGRLFPDPEPKTDKHPVASGPCNIDGKEYKMALWKAKSKDDKPYYNIKFTIMQEKPPEVKADDDNIPF